MDIRHGKGILYYARKRGDICHLLQSVVVPYRVNELVIGVYHAINTHTIHEMRRYAPMVIIYSL